MPDDLIPPETAALVGKPAGEPTEGDVLGKETVRFAQAVDDLNPLYLDDEYARAAGYEGAIAPPMFFNVALTGSRPLSETREDGLFRSGEPGPRFNKVNRTMFGGEEVEFVAPIYPGDTLRGETVLESIDQKDGRSGSFVVTVRKTTIRNQDGEIVAISRSSGITR